MSIGLNWCFTINNYTKSDLASIEANMKHIRYIICGKEIGEKGTNHLQGYIQLYTKQRISYVKKIFPRAHLEIAKGSLEQNIAYCSKYDKSPIIIGEPKKTAQESKKQNMYDAIQQCETWNDVLQVKGVSHCLNYAREVWNNKPIEKMEGFEPRYWQSKVLDIIKSEADGHTINYIYDSDGNSGKTYLCKYLVSNYDAFYCSPSKSTDIFCAYANQLIILYDIPMSCDEQYINWGAIEKLKDGILFSGKYNSSVKFRQKNAHVFIFSNHELPDGSFSKNRKINRINVKELGITPGQSNKVEPTAKNVVSDMDRSAKELRHSGPIATPDDIFEEALILNF